MIIDSGVQFGIVMSLFNYEITGKLLHGALSRLKEVNVQDTNIEIIEVPGAIEIPLTAKLLAKSQNYDAVICLGAVIQGETNHFEYVCQQVSMGCQQVMLEYEVPVIFGVLTTKNMRQAHERAGGREGNKGIEAVDAAIRMVEIIRQFS